MASGKHKGVLIAGGGVAGCLAALALARLRPDIPVTIVEEQGHFGGGRFEYLFDQEMDENGKKLLDPIVEQRWTGYYLAFPERNRKLKSGISGFGPDALHRAMVATLEPRQMRLATRIVAVREESLVLDGGETIKAEGVIDARGPANLSILEWLHETRIERVIRLPAPHRLDRPVLIDANVDQGAGFSFVQTFPIDDHRLQIGGVLVSDRIQPDEAAAARLDDYFQERGWASGAVEWESKQSRPLPIAGDFDAFWRIGGARVAKLGIRGGFVRPTTGRSVADAVRTAMLLAGQNDFAGAALHDLFEEQAKRLWRVRELDRSVNAALAAVPPVDRRPLAQRLYGLEPALLARFQADRTGLIDRRRIKRALAG